MRNNLIYFILYVLISFGCANQTAPTGGPKDEDPPVLIQSNPEDQQINFTGQEISLTFNEYVKLNNARQKIIITPRLDQEITYTSRRNKVFIEFEKPLAENTTYSINFRDAIQDITESNPANLNLAFSTGSYIDSLNISGNVYDLLKGEPLENVLVALQLPLDTAYYFSVPPIYFTNTLKDGTFSFSNLKDDTYRLYAFNDINNDLKLQPSRERHGFIPEPVYLNHDTSGVSIPLVNINTDSLKIISARQAGKYFEINFNKYIVSYDIDFADNSLPYMLKDDFKTIRFFNIEQLSDSIPAFVTAQDSMELTLQERVYIKYQPTVRQSDPFNFSTASIRLSKENPKVNTKVTFNKPIEYINTDSIYFFIDSLNIIPVGFDNILFDSSRTVMHINQTFDPQVLTPEPKAEEAVPSPDIKSRKAAPKANPILYFGQAAFISVENDTSKQVKNNINLFTESAVGILLVEIDVPYNSFIVELLNGRYEVVERRYNDKSIRFTNLSPGNFFLRVLEDSDNDQFWEIGNIYWNIPPKDVVYYINPEDGKQFSIRANWELGPYTVTAD